MYPDHNLSFDEAVRAWNSAHPLKQPPGRLCPVCSDKSFDVLPDGTRWVCYSSARPHPVGRPVKGNGARWTGDALDLEALRLRVGRVDVLRASGFREGRTRPARAAPWTPPAPAPLPLPRDPLAAWGELTRGDGARDLVRYDAAGALVVRCYSREGRPVAIRRVHELPPGWFGTTPATARAVLVEGGAGRFLTAGAFLDGDTTGDALVLCSDPGEVLRRRVSVEHADRAEGLARALGGRVELVELLVGAEVSRG